MRRYWLDDKISSGQVFQLKDDLFHHIIVVCRQGLGSQFELISTDGKAHLVEVLSVGKKTAEVKAISERELAQLKKPHIHLVLAISRFPVMDVIVEKSVEMGVKAIHPVVSEFSQIRSIKEFPQDRLARWERLVKMATQQSGRGELMQIERPRTVKEILTEINQKPKSLGLFAYEGDGGLPVKQHLQQKRAEIHDLDTLWLFVGSEGGFSTEEVKDFKATGLSPITLGEQVLRVETACITLVSILKYEFELLR